MNSCSKRKLNQLTYLHTHYVIVTRTVPQMNARDDSLTEQK